MISSIESNAILAKFFLMDECILFIISNFTKSNYLMLAFA